MVRVHEGLEPKPLPMLEPAPIAPPPQEPRRERRRRQGPNLGQELGRAVDNILRDILGN